MIDGLEVSTISQVRVLSFFIPERVLNIVKDQKE
jgi:hypothetical protein